VQACYLCWGKATTRDHIPPKGLIPCTRTADLVTVPACSMCNRKISLDDEYLRLVLTTGSSEGRVAQQVLKKRAFPAQKTSSDSCGLSCVGYRSPAYTTLPESDRAGSLLSPLRSPVARWLHLGAGHRSITSA